jgi:hypothetical protein
MLHDLSSQLAVALDIWAAAAVKIAISMDKTRGNIITDEKVL